MENNVLERASYIGFRSYKGFVAGDKPYSFPIIVYQDRILERRENNLTDINEPGVLYTR